jgi:hypothetical protein
MPTIILKTFINQLYIRAIQLKMLQEHVLEIVNRIHTLLQKKIIKITPLGFNLHNLQKQSDLGVEGYPILWPIVR